MDGEVLVKLETMSEDIREIRDWMRKHDKEHMILIQDAYKRGIDLEGRLTKLETSVQTRTAIGIVGIVGSFLAQMFGVPAGKP